MKRRTPYYDLGGWESPRRRRRWPWMLVAVALLGIAAWMWSGALRAQWHADAAKRSPSPPRPPRFGRSSTGSRLSRLSLIPSAVCVSGSRQCVVAFRPRSGGVFFTVEGRCHVPATIDRRIALSLPRAGHGVFVQWEPWKHELHKAVTQRTEEHDHEQAFQTGRCESAGTLALGGSAQAANNEANNPYMDSHVTGGFGAGAVIGTLLGEPIGTVVGALGGALVGEQVAIKHELGDENLQASNTIAGLKTHLAGTQAENAELKAQQPAWPTRWRDFPASSTTVRWPGASAWTLGSVPARVSWSLAPVTNCGNSPARCNAFPRCRFIWPVSPTGAATLSAIWRFPPACGGGEAGADRSRRAGRANRSELLRRGPAKAKAGDIDGLALDRRVSIELKAERTAEADPAVVSGVVSR